MSNQGADIIFSMFIRWSFHSILFRSRTPGEADAFHLMSLDEVRRALATGQFKPNTGMTWLAHFVRHEILNAENEADLIKICIRLY